MNQRTTQTVDDEWITFPGGELEGKRPKALCAACREQLRRAAQAGLPQAGRRGAVCFQCYRAELEREKALKAAGQLDTSSLERFQCALPFEPVNKPRLEMLKAERASARAAVSGFAGQRRRAQIAARHALQAMAAGLTTRVLTTSGREEGVRLWAAAVHAAELQLPESWLPFVVAR